MFKHLEVINVTVFPEAHTTRTFERTRVQRPDGQVVDALSITTRCNEGIMPPGTTMHVEGHPVLRFEPTVPKRGECPQASLLQDYLMEDILGNTLAGRRCEVLTRCEFPDLTDERDPYAGLDRAEIDELQFSASRW